MYISLLGKRMTWVLLEKYYYHFLDCIGHKVKPQPVIKNRLMTIYGLVAQFLHVIVHRQGSFWNCICSQKYFNCVPSLPANANCYVPYLMVDIHKYIICMCMYMYNPQH